MVDLIEHSSSSGRKGDSRRSARAEVSESWDDDFLFQQSKIDNRTPAKSNCTLTSLHPNILVERNSFPDKVKHVKHDASNYDTNIKSNYSPSKPLPKSSGGTPRSKKRRRLPDLKSQWTPLKLSAQVPSPKGPDSVHEESVSPGWSVSTGSVRYSPSIASSHSNRGSIAAIPPPLLHRESAEDSPLPFSDLTEPLNRPDNVRNDSDSDSDRGGLLLLCGSNSPHLGWKGKGGSKSHPSSVDERQGQSLSPPPTPPRKRWSFGLGKPPIQSLDRESFVLNPESETSLFPSRTTTFDPPKVQIPVTSILSPSRGDYPPLLAVNTTSYPIDKNSRRTSVQFARFSPKPSFASNSAMDKTLPEILPASSSIQAPLLSPHGTGSVATSGAHVVTEIPLESPRGQPSIKVPTGRDRRISFKRGWSFGGSVDFFVSGQDPSTKQAAAAKKPTEDDGSKPSNCDDTVIRKQNVLSRRKFTPPQHSQSGVTELKETVAKVPRPRAKLVKMRTNSSVIHASVVQLEEPTAETSGKILNTECATVVSNIPSNDSIGKFIPPILPGPRGSSLNYYNRPKLSVATTSPILFPSSQNGPPSPAIQLSNYEPVTGQRSSRNIDKHSSNSSPLILNRRHASSRSTSSGVSIISRARAMSRGRTTSSNSTTSPNLTPVIAANTSPKSAKRHPSLASSYFKLVEQHTSFFKSNTSSMNGIVTEGRQKLTDASSFFIKGHRQSVSLSAATPISSPSADSVQNLYHPVEPSDSLTWADLSSSVRSSLHTRRSLPRRNSLSDLRIPVRISVAQARLTEDLERVKEFARGIDELKQLREQHEKFKIMGTTCPISSTVIEQNTPAPNASEKVSHSLDRLDLEYKSWWEQAEALVDLGDGTSADEPKKNHVTDVPLRSRCAPLVLSMSNPEDDTLMPPTSSAGEIWDVPFNANRGPSISPGPNTTRRLSVQSIQSDRSSQARKREMFRGVLMLDKKSSTVPSRSPTTPRPTLGTLTERSSLVHTDDPKYLSSPPARFQAATSKSNFASSSALSVVSTSNELGSPTSINFRRTARSDKGRGGISGIKGFLLRLRHQHKEISNIESQQDVESQQDASTNSSGPKLPKLQRRSVSGPFLPSQLRPSTVTVPPYLIPPQADDGCLGYGTPSRVVPCNTSGDGGQKESKQHNAEVDSSKNDEDHEEEEDWDKELALRSANETQALASETNQCSRTSESSPVRSDLQPSSMSGCNSTSTAGRLTSPRPQRMALTTEAMPSLLIKVKEVKEHCEECVNRLKALSV